MPNVSDKQSELFDTIIKICQDVVKRPHGQVSSSDDPFVYKIGAQECLYEINRLKENYGQHKRKV